MPRPHLGAWMPGPVAPRSTPTAWQQALESLASPLTIVRFQGAPAVAEHGHAQLGGAISGEALPLLAHVPSLLPEDLGDASFRRDHRVALAYVVGEMANGITSEALVEAAAEVGALGIFGAAGLSLDRVTQALDRLQASLAGRPFGVNLIHSPDDQRLEAALVELFLARGLRFLSASAYLDLTLPVVKYRVAGIHRDASTGEIVVPNKLMAKVSRVEVARRFFEPAPERFVAQLVAQGFLTAEQAQLAASIPMADDVTAEADSGGHTDNRPLVLLLPALQALRDEVSAAHGYTQRPRVGAGGGIATPASVASAFAMGAAYVVTGSVNQATLEAGTSDAVRAMLAQAATTDVAMAPAADMFEMGVKVQVLTRGTLFAVRATRLYELYRAYDSVAALPAAVRDELEKKYFLESLEAAWQGVQRFFAERDPAQLARAEKEPKHQLALLFRSYLGQASRWANAGVASRRLDYQVWCGPSMGAFNEWVKGSALEPWEARHAGLIAKNLMVGAAVLTRLTALRTQGVDVPASLERFSPKTEAELKRLSTPRMDAAVAVAATPVVKSRAASASKAEPIAIVGLGALFPQAENLQAFWRLLRTGRDAVGDIPKTHWSLDDYYDADPHAPDKTYAKRGAFLPSTPFDPTEWGIPPSILEATDTAQLLGLVVARMAMEDAGYGEGSGLDRSRASVILGVTGTQELVITLGSRLGHPRWRKALKDSGVDDATATDVVQRISESYASWQENSFPGLLGNVVAGRIANRLDFGGTNCVIDAACASSLGAVHLGVQELRTGHSDLVLTGGVDCLNDIFMHMCFSKTPALSASGDARPFSDKADGTLLGEGLGMVVLKRLSDAERDGDRIYAVIRSVGTSSDGRAKSIYAPLAKGQSRALRSAYELAGVRPRDIALVEAHGTGTKAGDAAEVEALNAVFREDSADPAWCTLGSVKSQVGHTKAAAGAAGLIKAALALHHKVLPPSLKVEAPNPALKLDTSPFTISSLARPWLRRDDVPRLAAVSSFGFGGSNFHLVLAEHGEQRSAPAWDGSVELVAVSGADSAAVLAKAKELIGARDRSRALAQARTRFRSTDAVRLTAVMTDDGSLEQLLAPALQHLQKSPLVAFSSPDGVQVGLGKAAGSLAFVFPGQGAQYVDMLRDVATVFPELIQSVESDSAIASKVYPLATFDAKEKQRREAALTKTHVAQPAIGAVSRGAFDILARFGVRPALVAGHSYGELMALHAAGVFDAPTLQQVSHLRGSLMAGNGEDRGTMLAVLAPLASVEAVLREEKLDLVLANRNGPAQGVLSGTRAEIDRAEQVCQAKGLRTARLQVGAAFHSPLVSKAAHEFRRGLEGVTFGVPHTKVIANTTASAYPADAEAAKDLLGQQLAMPVRFDEVVERLFAEGARTFVEVGPKTALTGMVRAILGSRTHSAIALDAGGRRGGVFDLALVLARLAAEGHAIDLSAWQEAPKPPRWVEKPPRVAKMSVPLTGANYRAPYTPKPVRAPLPARAPSPAVVAQPTLAVSSSGQLQGLAALQAMQEQTARLHQSFLEGQLAAQQQLQAMLGGQPVAMAPRVAAAVVKAPVVAKVAAPPQVVVAAPVVKPVVPAVDVNATLLSVVSELTGYPAETLQLEMDLEADLGIDSIKRVEILSALSKKIPGAPSVNPEKLGALKTLQQVVDFIGVGVAVTPVAVSVAPSVNVTATLLSVVSELTGYPAETLQLGMDLEADLGIDSIKRVEILSALSKKIPGAPSVNPEKLGALKTLQQVVDFIGAGAPTPVASPIVNVTSTLLSVVSELTGYPAETLQLGMDLEADLGIDSIKRVEILSALSKKIPGAPSVNPEKLGALKTLQQVADFIGAGAPTPVASPNVNVASTLLSVVSELTGYPAETLQLGMDLEADLGIDSIKRVEILSALSKKIPGAPSVNPEKLGALKTLQQVVDFIGAGAPTPVASPNVNVTSTLLSVVSELTGYPAETLQLGMDLEADLGIDSIKRVEILSALSKKIPGAPSVNPEKLGALKTLQQVADFISNQTSQNAPIADSAPSTDAAGTLLSVVSELTGYPTETLHLGMALEADLGIDSNKRLELLTALARRLPQAASVNPEKLGEIKTLQQVVDSLTSTHLEVADALARRVVVAVRAPAGAPVALPTGTIALFGDDAALANALVQRLKQSGISALHLPTLESVPADLAGVLVLAPRRAEWSSEAELALKRALMLARAVASKLKAAGKNAFFATVTRRDGAFGLSTEQVTTSPLDGGLAGLAKTAAHEWPEVRCRAFDVSHLFDEVAAANAIVEELTNDGPRELGLGPAGRLTLSTRLEAVTQQPSALRPGDVVIVTGGARGVTAECARALAQATQVTLVLLGRSPVPQAEPEWLTKAGDEASIKRALLDHATGEKPTPRVLGERTKAALAAREIRTSLQALETLGLRAEYRCADVRDEASMAALFTEVRTSLGPIRGLIHGAGVLRDRRIEDKRDDDFDQVLDPKIAGARALLKAARADDLRFIALFASVTGRFGRRGQADYAVANQALVSIARAEAARRRDCRVVAFDWGPWEGGMVTPALKAEFEKEGISLIPLAAGAQAMVAEVNSPAGGPIEVVFGAGFGDEAPANWAAVRAYRLDSSWPVLADHRLAGRSVLPLAMSLEWLAAAFPMRIALEDVRVLKGVTVGTTPEDVVVWVSAPERTALGVRHQVELRNAKDQVHVRATAVLEPHAHPVALALPGGLRPYVQTMAATYSEQLFHGPSLQVIEAIEGLSDQGMILKLRAELTSAKLLPGEPHSWATNPLIVDGVFQALIVWCRAQKGAPSLPSRLGAWRQFAGFSDGVVRAVVRVREVDSSTVTSDVDLLDEGGQVLARLEGYVCTVSPSLDRAFGVDAAVSSSVVPTA